MQRSLLKQLFSICTLVLCLQGYGQVRVSFATDVSGVRNFSPQQKFWAIGQTVQAQFYLSDRNAMYVWLIYFSPGRFDNDFRATARSAATSPSTYDFKVKGVWNMKEFSIGWKHYFKGAADMERGNSGIYGLAGFGLMFTGVKNTYFTEVDTALYTNGGAPLAGSSSFRRLILDLGLGYEVSLGADFYVYADARTMVRASSYPSPYFHRTKDVPLPLIASLGVRIRFGLTD